MWKGQGRKDKQTERDLVAWLEWPWEPLELGWIGSG